MGYVRAAYLEEIRPHIYKGEYPIKEGKALRRTKHGPIEVWNDLRITVCRRSRKGERKSGNWWATRGQVLTVRWRKPNKWEIEEYQKPIEQCEISVPMHYINDEQMIAVVERDPNLYSAGRRFLRHIISSLMESFHREAQREAGGHTISKKWIEILNQVLINLTNTLNPGSKESRRAIITLKQLLSVLSGTRSQDLQEAQRIVRRAVQNEDADQIEMVVRTIGLIGKYRIKLLRQARGIVRKGLAIIEVLEQIDRGVRLVYEKNIPDFLRELRPYAIEGKLIQPKKIFEIAQRIAGLYHFIQRVCGGFNPYAARARSSQIRRLGQAYDYAEKGDAKGLYNALTRAHAKLEALVLGECLITEEIIEARKFVRNIRY